MAGGITSVLKLELELWLWLSLSLRLSLVTGARWWLTDTGVPVAPGNLLQTAKPTFPDSFGGGTPFDKSNEGDVRLVDLCEYLDEMVGTNGNGMERLIELGLPCIYSALFQDLYVVRQCSVTYAEGRGKTDACRGIPILCCKNCVHHSGRAEHRNTRMAAASKLRVFRGVTG